MNDWNFRRGFRGKLVLQRLIEWSDDGYERAMWRDATVEDLRDYYTAIKDALAQPEERNFCPRCGKRTADLTTIHTCTPPQIDPNQWAFDNGLEST